MRKTSNNNVNRNTHIFNHIRKNISHNAVTPDFFFNQLWLREEESNGVKIIELNSSSSSRESSTKNEDCNENGLDSKVLKDANYKVNEEARQRRRLRNEHSFTPAYNEYYFDQDNPFYTTYDSEIPINHQMNCFTIINNQQYSDSSSKNDCEAIEIIEVDTDDNKYWDHVYNEEVVAFDPKTQSEKRTVWIYSYKNKHLLSDNDFELVNIPTKDSSSSTSHSISDDEEIVTNHRMGSPIPNYVPKLDLSIAQTLSTVTEISEQKSSNRSSHEKIRTKPINNWFTERNDKVKKNENDVLNWMALSPRERRRRSINTSFEVTDVMNREVDVTHIEGEEIIKQNTSCSNKTTSKAVQVELDINLDNEPRTEPEPRLKETEDILPINIFFADADNEGSVECYELKDDKIPSFKIDGKINKAEITEPMEKLDSNNWIAEHILEEKHNYDDFSAENDVEECYPQSIESEVSQRLWTKNLQLMKPPQWAEYLPITCSPPSLHLSLSLPSVNSCRKSWFKRLTRYIMCCK